jgi:hypothetical protein
VSGLVINPDDRAKQRQRNRAATGALHPKQLVGATPVHLPNQPSERPSEQTNRSIFVLDQAEKTDLPAAMSIDNQGATQKRLSRRRIAAILLSPLGVAPFMLFSAWDYMPSSSESEIATYWDYLWTGLATASLLSAPAGVVVWYLFSMTRLRERAWLVIPLFSAVLAGVAMLSDKNSGPSQGLVMAMMFGLPVSLAYCLIAGVPWTLRKTTSQAVTPTAA